jgi:hypothetical protein
LRPGHRICGLQSAGAVTATEHQFRLLFLHCQTRFRCWGRLAADENYVCPQGSVNTVRSSPRLQRIQEYARRYLNVLRQAHVCFIPPVARAAERDRDVTECGKNPVPQLHQSLFGCQSDGQRKRSRNTHRLLQLGTSSVCEPNCTVRAIPCIGRLPPSPTAGLFVGGLPPMPVPPLLLIPLMLGSDVRRQVSSSSLT